MSTSVIITLVAAFLWAITNHIDKYMLSKIDSSTSNIKTLLLFSSFVAGLVMSPIWLFVSKFRVQIDLIPLILIFAAAALYILATYFYFKALEKNDASIVVVMFQLIPVFSYIFSLILFGENLNANEIIGALIIISSAIIISLDFSKNSNRNKTFALILMTLSSLLYSLYFICFDASMRSGSYNSVAFWYQIGLLVCGIVLFCIKSFRTSFIAMIRSNGKKIISLNITNEILNLIANLMVNFANLTIPLALVNTLNGFQGAFCFIIGAIGVTLFPVVFSEELNKKIIVQKTVSILLGIIGLIIMFI